MVESNCRFSIFHPYHQMNVWILLVLTAVSSVISYTLGKRKSLKLSASSAEKLHSLPTYYGWHSAICCGLPALLLISIWLSMEQFTIERLIVNTPAILSQTLSDNELNLLMSEIRNAAAGIVLSDTSDILITASSKAYKELQHTSRLILWAATMVCLVVGGIWGYRTICPTFRARIRVEFILRLFLIVMSTLAIFTTIGIILSVLFESIRFFKLVPLTDFLFGLEWSPQTAIRSDQVGSTGAFGAIPVFTGTLMITLIAMLIAAPVGLLSAIYLSEYASYRLRSTAKPILEILAGIPTVVYGFFAALIVAPMLRNTGDQIGLGISSESALAAGIVMGIMIIPFVSSLSDDVINAVPQSMRDGSYALGATQSETVLRVLVPAALPGIIGSLLLAISRAIGETMIVVMAAGLAANLTANPFEAVTTVTVQIVTLLIGDQEFDSAKTLAAFALGLMLFIVTLILNVIALTVVRKYREQYE